MMRRLRGVARYVSIALTLLLMGVLAFAVLEYATGTQPFYVVGDSPSSMSPTLNYGDVAVIYKAPFSGVDPGSIIAFHDPRGNPGIIVHRVVSLAECGAEACLVTKGDNNATNPTADPWNVTQADYDGKVVAEVPYLGYLSPALWGFGGASALLPVSVAVIAPALVGVVRRISPNLSEGEQV